MPVWGTVRHQVGIAGRITDKSKDKPLSGARVTIRSDAGTAMTVTTPPDGRYHALDLPDGAYTISASLPGTGSRYGTAQTTATVSRMPQGRIVMATADLSLPPTTVQGNVTTAGGASVFMAEVRIQGSGERTFSDQDGGYTLSGVEAGSRTLLVSAQGFKPASRTVQLDQAGAVVKADVTLTNS
jgi:hypothetical protein